MKKSKLLATRSLQSSMYKLYFEGDFFYDALIKDIRHASSLIELEFYIFEADAIGTPILELLEQKSKNGVKVRLLIDGIGSHRLPDSWKSRLMQAGVELRIFRPVTLWTLFIPENNRRDHRKVAIFDGRIAYTGGMNIESRQSFRVAGKQSWRDNMIRLEGIEIVRKIQRSFHRIWYSVDKWGKIFPLTKRNPSKLDVEANGIWILESHPRKNRLFAKRMLARTLMHAEKRIWIESPYFAPRIYLLRLIVKAAARGVEVKVITSKQSGITRWAGCALYGSLIKRKVEIYESVDRFIHAKGILVDNRFSMVGSSNMDYRSSLHNREFNLMIVDENVNAKISKQVLKDLKGTEKIEYDVWVKRPVVHKLLEKFFYLFRYYL